MKYWVKDRPKHGLMIEIFISRSLGVSADVACTKEPVLE